MLVKQTCVLMKCFYFTKLYNNYYFLISSCWDLDPLTQMRRALVKHFFLTRGLNSHYFHRDLDPLNPVVGGVHPGPYEGRGLGLNSLMIL